MKKNNNTSLKKSNIERTLRSLTIHKEAPQWTVVFFALIYIVANVATILVATSSDLLLIGEIRMPLSSLAGVLSSIANMCLIFMVVFYSKVGFIIAAILMGLQLPKLLYEVIVNHTPTSFQGVFSNVLAFVSILLIFLNNTKIEKYQQKVRDHAVTDVLTKLPNRFASTELVERFVKQGKKFAVVSMDLNNFKNINETMGQSTGNGVLVEVASRWKKISDTGASGTVLCHRHTEPEECNGNLPASGVPDGPVYHFRKPGPSGL